MAALDLSWLARLRRDPVHVAAVGDTCLDVYLDTDRVYIGGNAVNVAIDLANAGLPVDYIGRVGDDDDGRLITSTLEEFGVAARPVIEAAPTCRALLRVGDGVPTVVEDVEGDCSYFRMPEGMLDAFAQYSIVLMKAVEPIDGVIAGLRERGIPSLYDYSTFHEELGATAPDISVFSAEGLDDRGILGLLTASRDRGSLLSVVTMGPRGSIALLGDELITTPAEPVEVVDTIGAGDAFLAALVVALIRGAEVPEALRSASREGSLTCTFEGAWRRPDLVEAPR
ncbi:MAG: PfkB family carbohydrate kinase [Protaetiibacter sp.]